MSHYATIPCPNCQRDLRVRSVYFGLNVNCKRCGHLFTVRPEDSREPIPESLTTHRGETEAKLEDQPLDLRERWTDAEARAEAALQQLRESDSARAKLAEWVTQLVAELEEVQERLRQSEGAQEELKTARDESERLRTELVSKSLDLEVKSAQREALLTVSRDEVKTLQAKIQEHERREAEIEDERTTALAAESARAAGLQEELDRIQEHLQQEEAARLEFVKDRSELDRLRAQLPVLNARAIEADRLNEELRSERDETGRLQIQIGEARQAEERAANLLAELGQIQIQLKNAESAEEDLKIARAEIDQLGAELSDLRERVAETDCLREAFRVEHDERIKLKAEYDKTREADAQVARDLIAELDEAKGTRDGLESELKDLREQLESHEGGVAKHKDYIEKLLHGQESERAARELLELEVARLRSTEADRQAMGKQLTYLGAELEAARDGCERLRSEIERKAVEQAEQLHLAEELAQARRVQADLVQQLGAMHIEQDKRRHEDRVMVKFPDRPNLESDADAETLRTELESWLTESQRRHKVLLSIAQRLDEQMQAAREDLAAVHRDLVLGQWGSDDDDNDEFPFG